MKWTALIPLKAEGERKMRLAAALTAEERTRLADDLLARTLDAVRAASTVDGIALLSAIRPRAWEGCWIPDVYGDLNAALSAGSLALQDKSLLVILPDLPLVAASEIDDLLEAAQDACAIAPDRHLSGTNALAIPRPERRRFAFGQDSFRKHLAAFEGRVRIVMRPGLSLDIDTPDDLAVARSQGFHHC